MKRILLCIALLTLFALWSDLPAQVPEWDDTVTTYLASSTANKMSTIRSLQVGPDNTLHVIYYEQMAGEWNLYYVHRDMDDIWSDPELVQTSTWWSADACIIVDPQQNYIRVYRTMNGDLHELERVSANNWVANTISTGVADIQSIDADTDSYGNVHIAGLTGNMAAEAKIIYVTDFNGTWEFNVMMDSALGGYGLGANPRITVSDEGIVAMGYRGGNYMMYDVHIAQNQVPGEFNWTYEVILSPNAESYDAYPLIVGDTLHLTYSGQDGWGFPWTSYYTSRPLTGTNWIGSQTVSGGLSLNNSRLAIDLEGNAHVVMIEIDGNFATGYIHYSTNASGTWVVSNPFGTQAEWDKPSFMIDHAGNFQFLKLSVYYDGGLQWGIVHRGAPFEMVLPIPQDLEAVVDGFNVYLSWEEPDIDGDDTDLILEGYNIWRQSFGEGPFDLLNDEPVTDTEYQNINLYPGDYAYYVTAIYEDLGQSKESNTVYVTVMDMLPAPEFDPAAGEYVSYVYVTISSPNDIGTIHYTLNGEDPDEESPIYDNPIMIDETTVVKARTYHADWLPSPIVEAEYVIVMDMLPAPEFDPPAGEYLNFVYVSIESPNNVGVIHYTLNGEDPNENSPIYDDPIMIDETTVIKARTYHDDWLPSPIVEAEYVIETTNVEDDLMKPETQLYGARPNPFNPSTVISFSLRDAAPVNISVYNIMGQRVNVLVNDVKDAGRHEIVWDGRDESGNSLPSGVYFYRMRTPDNEFLNKMMLLK